jgi:hypothetical protein
MSILRMVRPRGRVSTLLGPIGLSGLLVAAFAVASLSSSSAPAAGATIQINGHPVSSVRYHGQTMSLGDYQRTVEPAAAASGAYLNLFIDPSAVARGYLVAFSDRNESDAYALAHGMADTGIGSGQAAGDRMRAAQAATVRAMQPMWVGGHQVALAACDGSTNYYAQLYDGGNCTGQLLSMLSRDIVYRMSDYNFDKKASSFWLGQCIVSLKLFGGINLTGEQHTYGGGGQAYGAILFNNLARSASTPGANC